MYDLIVLGAGCTGLSFAHQLVKLGQPTPHILFLESRTAYVHDRIWCHWSLGSPLIDESWIDHRWNRIRLNDDQRSVEIDVTQTPYCRVASGPFYAAIQKEIEQSPSLELKMGVSVTSPPEIDPKGFRVRTDAGDFLGRMILETRPKQGDLLPPGLWQSFLGREIETETPVFKPDTAVLMAFERPSRHLLEFLYVLPLSERRALFEWTVFDAERQLPESFEPQLSSKIKEWTGAGPILAIREEKGVIPMGRQASSGLNGVIDCSLGAGMSRMSTGYAFSTIQRWATAAASDFVAHGSLNGPPPLNPWIHWMDERFLRRIQDYPERAPDFLMDLFDRTPPYRLIEFLEGRGRPLDLLHVMSSQVSGYLKIRHPDR
jgi:lycopene beta-cyclase